MFDSADVYSAGQSELVLGAAIKGRRNQLLISTKATFSSGNGAYDFGSSRFHLIEAVEAALKRLQTDHIDLFQPHGFDAMTTVEETLSALDDLICASKIRYIGGSNFSGKHPMKSLAAADRHNLPRYIARQAYYLLIDRDYESKLMPPGLDQCVGAVVFSPLGWERLTGKLCRDVPLPANSRLHNSSEFGPQVSDDYLYSVLDALDAVAEETGKTVPQL